MNTTRFCEEVRRLLPAHGYEAAEPRMRLPVGLRTRETMDARAAAAQGTRHRPLDGAAPPAPAAKDEDCAAARPRHHT